MLQGPSNIFLTEVNMNIKSRQFLSLVARVVILSALAFLSQVSTAFADYNQWYLVQPVGWQNLDQRCTDAGTVRIDRVTANSRGGSALISFFYNDDEWGWGCQKGESQQFLYSWLFDRDVSSVSGNRGDTVVVATLGLESSSQPPPNCPRLNPYLSVGSDISDDFASSVGGEARFYADSRDNFHVPGPRVFRINNPAWPDAGIRVSLETTGGAGRCIDLRITYAFKSGTGGPSGAPIQDPSGRRAGNRELGGEYTCQVYCPAGGEGAVVRIEQRGTALVFINEGGRPVQRISFVDASTVVANEWGGLRATVHGGSQELHWANRTVWRRR